MRKPLVRQDRILWHSQDAALQYAHARHMLYGTRQQVRQVTVDGVPMWRVSRSCRPAPLRVAVGEPCS